MAQVENLVCHNRLATGSLIETFLTNRAMIDTDLLALIYSSSLVVSCVS